MAVSLLFKKLSLLTSGPGQVHGSANVRPTRPGSFNGHIPPGPSQEFGQHGTSRTNGLVSNCAEFADSRGNDREIGASSDGVCNMSGPSVPWWTKPRARVYTGSDPCIGLSRLPNLHTSDVSDSTTSHINATQFDSNYDDIESYIPIPIGEASWYPDSGDTSQGDTRINIHPHHIFTHISRGK